jgi:hypothetical protein
MKLSELKKIIQEAVSTQMSKVVEETAMMGMDDKIKGIAGALPGAQQKAHDDSVRKDKGQSIQVNRGKMTDAPQKSSVPVGTRTPMKSMEEATPPPIPTQDPKRARLDAIAAKVKAEREKAAAQHAPENKALDKSAFALADKHGSQELSEQSKSNSVKITSAELLEMIDQAVKEVLEEKKKAGKWNFEKKKGEDKKDSKESKSDKKSDKSEKKPFPPKKK